MNASQLPSSTTLSLTQRQIFIAQRGFAFCCTCPCPGVLVAALSIDLAGPTHILAPPYIGHDLKSVGTHFREVHKEAYSDWSKILLKYGQQGMILQIATYSGVSLVADEQPPSDGSLTFYWPRVETGSLKVLYCPDPSCPTGIFPAAERGSKKPVRYFKEHGLDLKTLQQVISLFGLQGICCCSETLCST